MEIPSKICRHCGTRFDKPSTSSYKQWDRRFCCSKKCGDESKKTPWLVEYQMKPGSTLGQSTQFKLGMNERESNHKWKGDDASYSAIHMWVGNHWGTPQKCEHCGTDDEKQYHWANISRTYIREKSDWLRLCVSCHKRFDLQNPA